MLKTTNLGVISTRLAPFLLLALLACSVVGCSPRSVAARGEVADAVAAALESGQASFDHSRWSRLLAAGTRGGNADYDYFSQHRSELESYLDGIANVELAELSKDHLLALLINAYNAYTVISILDHPGINSIKEINGVWDTRTHSVGGFELTLDNIEHNLIRPFYRDPRIHFAVNCASRSCAPLPPWAFDGERIDEQLDTVTRDFFNDPRFLRADGDGVATSKLLDWYGGDFTATEARPRAESIASFIAGYVDDETLTTKLQEPGARVGFLEYDWALNSVDS